MRSTPGNLPEDRSDDARLAAMSDDEIVSSELPPQQGAATVVRGGLGVLRAAMRTASESSSLPRTNGVGDVSPSQSAPLVVPVAGADTAQTEAALDDEIAALLADIADPHRRVPVRRAAEMYQEWRAAGFVGARPAQASEPTAPDAVRRLRENAFTRRPEGTTD